MSDDDCGEGGFCSMDQEDADGDGIGDVCEEMSTVIALSSFTASPSSRAVILAWATASEIDTAGFNIYRADAEGGEYIKINAALIPAEGASTQGTSYEFTDKNMKNRRTYWYKLEDVDLKGLSTHHGPISATPRLIFGGR
jgi:hypothetical protein